MPDSPGRQRRRRALPQQRGDNDPPVLTWFKRTQTRHDGSTRGGGTQSGRRGVEGLRTQQGCKAATCNARPCSQREQFEGGHVT
eukprot:13774039-Alexandrium_andersonii.AAC.1